MMSSLCFILSVEISKTSFFQKTNKKSFLSRREPHPMYGSAYLCKWSIKFLCINTKDLIWSGNIIVVVILLFKSSNLLTIELKYYVLLLVNDSERGMQICSYDTQASHGGKTQCYKCWGERGVGRKSYLVPICQYINTVRWYDNTVLFLSRWLAVTGAF